jgi:hypothetical protein
MAVSGVHSVLLAYLHMVSHQHHVSTGCKESICECVCHGLWVPQHSPASVMIRNSIETIHISSFNLVQNILKYHNVSQCINVVTCVYIM